DVRCDGIEASGLDENLNLIVDRQPVFYKIGKSTPELIVEKLYKKSENTERKLFGRILKRLKE
ncbi:endonuclease MutS2, partial [Thermococci archaeon]